MKSVFFFACILSVSGAMAQQKEVFDVENYLKDHKPTNYYSFLKPGCGTVPESFLSKERRELFSALPQDNMPCIVPDMNQFNMPVVTGKSAMPSSPASPGAIPNPAIPYPLPFNLTPAKKN